MRVLACKSKHTSYALSYQNNVNVGMATAVLTGMGYFTGILALPFTVDPLGLDDAFDGCSANLIIDK